MPTSAYAHTIEQSNLLLLLAAGVTILAHVDSGHRIDNVFLEQLLVAVGELVGRMPE